MLIAFIAVAQTMLYLASIPICAAFALSASDGLRFGVGVSAFARGAALRRARRYAPRNKGRRRGEAGARALWGAVRRLRGARIRVEGRLGLGEAAATAIACGALRALGAGRAAVDVTPVFDGDGLCLELTGMIRLRSGQIMRAMALGQIENIRRRIARWKDTRLKV